MTKKDLQVEYTTAVNRKLKKCISSYPIATFMIITAIYVYYINNITDGPVLVDYNELIKDEKQRAIIAQAHIWKIFAAIDKTLKDCGVKFKVVMGVGNKLMLFLYKKNPVKELQRLEDAYNRYDNGLSKRNPIIGNKLMEAKYRYYKAGKYNRNPFTDILDSWKKQDQSTI